jgi:Spx/MgsR family transcriptional regulator
MYGIPTCGSVKKAKKFFEENNIEYEFQDFKKSPVDCQKIEYWLTQIDIKTLLNNRGTKYRTLKLKDLNLNDDDKKSWLCKENMLIKRPVIEYNDIVTVAFDEEVYKNKFL